MLRAGGGRSIHELVHIESYHLLPVGQFHGVRGILRYPDHGRTADGNLLVPDDLAPMSDSTMVIWCHRSCASGSFHMGPCLRILPTFIPQTIPLGKRVLNWQFGPHG